ncbi:hypothetical protein EQV97_15995 [Pseudomonas sp. TMW22090]|uniref:hypothetical protein n=1 Tax=Pseudomonas sp. TMW22090 TaxID=2506434 RepID=UPI001F103FFD|nr:hypothetical protein [Pseudomonas sp. TMW22090]MCH4878880.1 hypothetical protein [Pseudomonas sp. TMW22090]
MTRSAVFLIAVLFSQAALSATPTVEAFLADPVALLDEQGKFEREMALKDAPKNPLPVLQYNEALELVQVELAGKKVWLDTMDLRLNPSKIVKLPCQKMPSSLAADSQNNSTIGFGAGCKH